MPCDMLRARILRLQQTIIQETVSYVYTSAHRQDWMPFCLVLTYVPQNLQLSCTLHHLNVPFQHLQGMFSSGSTPLKFPDQVHMLW